MASGSRYDKLRTIDMPVLIIHGQADPFIPIEHGIKSAELIPYVECLWVEGMAHDLPDAYIDVVIEKKIESIQRAE